ncbi:MAG TPA: HAMP domain-containing sensor histidine kinase [Burkholderiales bacterium]|nr:HAMP domain-containing sensor histidine kinase [Burkholderiales bacterium]
MKPSEPGTIDLKVLLASNIHEIKNLLLQLMLRLDTMDSASADVIDARLLCRRVNDRMVRMLLLYELQTDTLQLNLIAHNPADFIDDFVRNATALAGGRFIIERRADAMPDYWFFDRELVEMALLNAVHNALRYARQRIVIGAAGAGNSLMLSVDDDGTGYPQPVLEQKQEIRALKSNNGSGMGLFFARMIAEAHTNKDRRGALILHNKEGDSGAVFTLQLP